MTRFPAALLVFARILILWAAFHGVGRLLEKPLKRLSGSLPGPGVVTGMLFFLMLAFPLSLLHLLDASLMAGLVAAAGSYGLASLARGTVKRLRNARPGRPDASTIILVLLLLVLVPSTLFRASKPQDHSDPLITYAVQPDRWLEEGHMTFLGETWFSAMPLLGETLALWPASLAVPGVSGLEGMDSEDVERRTDRLSLLQIFQMSLLVAAVLLASRSMSLDASGTLLALTAVFASNMLIGWGSLAKVDMTLAFFVTAAMVIPARKLVSGAGGAGFWPFLLFGAALAVKMTAWILMPFFILLQLASERPHPGRLAAGTAVMLILPVCYMARTFVHTGSLLYSGPMSFPRAGGEWAWPAVPVLDSLSVREGPGLLADLGDLSLAWDYPLLLLVLGFAASAMKAEGRRERILLVAAFGGYMVLSALLLSPAEWSAKYTLMVLPLLAVLGASWRPAGWKGLIIGMGLAAAVAATSELAPRARFMLGFMRSSRVLTYDSDTYLSPRGVHLLANDVLSPGSVILSLSSDERYYSDFPVLCARTHPVARRLFLAGSLADELALLGDLGVTHVCFVRGDPMGMNMAGLNYWSPPRDAVDPSDSLAMLGAGRDVLREVASDGIYVLSRVEYP